MKLIFLFALLTFVNAAKELKIYVFNIGQGDSQLIVFPSGYSILIDVGDTDTNAKHTKYIAKQIETILGKKYVDILVLTHYHPDHYGWYGKRGIWYLLEKGGFTFGKFIKRNAGTYNGAKFADCNMNTITWKYVGTMKESVANFVCYAESQRDKTKLSAIAENARRCSTSQINPPDEGAEVQILMRDALGIKDSKGKKIYTNTMKKSKPVSENDFSICIRLQYGEFVYGTCGDMSGYEYSTTKTYHDVETSVAPMMGSVDILHVNHHGSKSATNTKWCKTLKPTVSIVSCGGSESLPSTRPFKNLKAVNSKVYTTGNDCGQDTIKKYKDIITQMGDDIIVTVPENGKTYTITNSQGGKAKTYNIKLNKSKPTCKKLQ